MRSRDLHILTSSEFAFSSDPRFGPEHMPGSDAWTLRLDSARKSDSGRYECQVNTEPKIMYAVQLSVRGDCRAPLYPVPPLILLRFSVPTYPEAGRIRYITNRGHERRGHCSRTRPDLRRRRTRIPKRGSSKPIGSFSE